MADKIKHERMPFTIIGDVIIEDLRVSKNALTVYLVLCKHSNSEGKCWPGLDRISKYARCSRSTTQRSIQELIDLGYIEKKFQYINNSKKQTSNLYLIRSQVQKRDFRGPVVTPLHLLGPCGDMEGGPVVTPELYTLLTRGEGPESESI